ncbi:GNAT family protein [Rhodanobacter sp. 7MK24]|uniref:GNAT family N-acetyltransferase n=1 Tax=Rhodanobacter sp. 7MK24 TaxID=2775922 RepID=UPI001CE21A19|nr:GNAT family protein [Rhodanobacter sp. 7MK24]
MLLPSRGADSVLLETARLRLDSLRGEDAQALFAYRADPSVSRYQGWRPTSPDETVRFIERQQAVAFDTPDSWFQFALRLRDSGELVGDLGLHFVNADTVEFGVTLSPAQQGRGLAAEAVRAVLALVFDSLKRHRVYASVDPRNLACVKLLERLGMRKEAHFRESWREGDIWVDDVIYAMLAGEWSARM